MVPSPQMPEFESSIVLNGPVVRLPVELDVSVPVRNFRVRNLLTLETAHLIESGWGHGEDVPLAAGHLQLAWSEFEVVDTQLAVRITRLA
jgi:flagellar motor switch/type III secretory pathway protein FliN